MSRLARVSLVAKPQPFRVLVYGIEGVGKSTFGADAPAPIFISAEGGTANLRTKTGGVIPEMPDVRTFEDVIDSVKELTTGKHAYQTVVLDSLDWIEKLAHAKIIGTSDKKDIIRAAGGYGAGFRASETMHKDLVTALDTLREVKQMNVISLAHYHVKTVKDPDAIQDYDAFEIKCHEYVSALWREWHDAVLFARFETHIKKQEDRARGRATGTDKRICYTTKRPTFQAKNRYGLPLEMDFSFAAFEAQLAKSRGATVEEIIVELESLGAKLPVERRSAMAKAASAANGDRAKLLSIRNFAKTEVANASAD